MKLHRLLLVGAAALMLTGTARAGDHHTGLTLRCADCHVMHFSQSHGYLGAGPNTTFLGTGPNEYLLRAPINDLCLSCHDQDSSAPDVLGAANGGNGPTDVRLAGYLNRLGLEGIPATGHTLDSTETAPGSDAMTPWSNPDGLNCADCHHQHGYGGGSNAYRNLLSNVGNSGFLGSLVTYNDTQIGTVDPTKDVFERQAAEYDEADMDWNEPDNNASAIGDFCGGCHENFHGSPGDLTTVGGVASGTNWDKFLRHPTAGVNIGALGGGHSSLGVYNSKTNQVKVMSENAGWDAVSFSADDATPTCVSCHKAHGNGNAYGLILRSGVGTLTVDGDTGATNSSTGAVMEHLCGQCHVQAAAFVGVP